MDAYTQTYSMDAAEQSDNVRAALLYGYGMVPLACVDTIERSGSDWTFSFPVLPAQYEGALWALSHSGTALEQSGDAVLVQTVQDGRIASQTLRVELAHDDAVMQAVLTGELDEAH